MLVAATPPGWSTSPNSPASTTRCTRACYAAEAIVESLKKDIDSVNFESYDKAIRTP